MHQKFIQKPSNFQTSLETLFSANRVHKSTKMRVQNHSKMKPFLGRVKNRESCSRLHADLVFEVQSASKPHLCSKHFRELSSCCLGTLVFHIFLQKCNQHCTPKLQKNEVTKILNRLHGNSSDRLRTAWNPSHVGGQSLSNRQVI